MTGTGLLLAVMRRSLQGERLPLDDHDARHSTPGCGCEHSLPGQRCYLGQLVHAMDAVKGRGADGVITIFEPCANGEHGDCIAVDAEPETRPADLVERCACTCHPLDAAVTVALSVLYSVGEDGCACLGESCSADDPKCDPERASAAFVKLTAARKVEETA